MLELDIKDPAQEKQIIANLGWIIREYAYMLDFSTLCAVSALTLFLAFLNLSPEVVCDGAKM